MILGMSIGAFILPHVIITLIAIASGLIVVGGMFASHKLPGTTALFLFTTALTSLTGFSAFGVRVDIGKPTNSAFEPPSSLRRRYHWQ